MKASIGVALGFAFTFGGCAHHAPKHAVPEEPPPPGWRLATANELQDPMREGSPSRYTEAIADFNGDGVLDRALVLKTTRYNGEGVLVYLSQGKEGYAWLNASETFWGNDDPDGPPAMGVDVVPPGEHAYICIERQRGNKCVDEGPGPKLHRTALPSIGYFKLGSAASLLAWDERSQHFIRVWVSD